MSEIQNIEAEVVGEAKNVAETELDRLTAKLKAAIDQWYADHFHNSVVSRDTAVHNLIHDAAPALVAAVVNAVQTKE